MPASAHPSPRNDDSSLPPFEPQVPGWVDAALGPRASRLDVGPRLHAIASGPLALLTTSIQGASALPACELRAAISAAYRALSTTLGRLQREPIRYWNYIPGIGTMMDDQLDRYMIFNAGRHDALAGTVGETTEATMERMLATASAVGVGGTDLIVHCLAADTPGIPVENPRQISSWQYSARYGPRPPRFSRATIATICGRRRLLIGGTASIVGEQSRHRDDMEAQLTETLRNLSALIASADSSSASHGDPLHHLTELRAYATSAAVAQTVRARLEESCPRAARLEIVAARVCRPELLLEIEGVADL